MSKQGIVMAATLVVAAGAGFAAYKYIYSGESNAGDLAGVIPADAYMAAYISNEPEAWEKLKKFGTPTAQNIITTQLNEAQQKFLAETKMDFSKDIQPWVGNTMMAILPGSDGKPDKPQVLIAIGIKDKLKALDFANKLKAQSKDPVKKFDYKGIEITDTGKGGGQTFTAIVNDRLVVAPEQKTIESAIDTAQGKPSLASKAGNDWFKADTLGLKQPIAAFYIPDYLTAVQELLKSGKTPVTLDPATMTQLKKIQSFGGGIAIDDAGIRMKIVAKTDGTTLNLPTTSAKAVSSFPADTLMVAGGTGLSQIWTEANKIAASQPTTQQALNQMRQSFTQSTQLDLDKDIFAWMGGDYTLGMMPVSSGITAAAGFGGALTIDSNDRAVTDNTMTKLVNLAKNSGFSVEQRQVGNAQISDVKAPAGQGTLFSYGWVSEKSMLLAVGDGLVEKIAQPSGESLDRSPNYTTALSSMSAQKQSYAYIDIEKVFNLYNSKMGAVAERTMPPDVNAIVTSIQGLGMSSAQPDKNTSNFEVLLTLKPATE
ncbi:DUF3352 domain-containing protein [Chamaesiphon minutus]|uniref:Uncharacterized protein n=1 Tax=Chamaesiphon minutus (strain ATCC 27169 / PCC 6605) TaxID=1173020 RepID=K9UP34_CHAP6|nr:DUF3352 domain-containing protein [Chamaesiphon minutus]AFY95954.1 Protein of unknown function (DUF3352) [Chamaesiphon minutus PCC 6605]